MHTAPYASSHAVLSRMGIDASLGRRVARTQGSEAVVFIQVDQQTIADYPRGGAASSPTYRYFWGSYIDDLIARKATGTSGELLFSHRTQQYTIVAISNAAGSVVERVAYTAYGQPTFTNASGSALSSSAKATRYTYTGREWDSSLELHHFRARWRSGVSGRFMARDPIGYEGSEWGLYDFVVSSSLTYTDPSGMARFRKSRTISHHIFVGIGTDPNGDCVAKYEEAIVWYFQIYDTSAQPRLGSWQQDFIIPIQRSNYTVIIDPEYCGGCPADFEHGNGPPGEDLSDEGRPTRWIPIPPPPPILPLQQIA